MNEKFFDLKSEKQDRMINASLHLFAVNGYKHASTDDIIKEAGISKGLLFHYFQSKQGLYEFLADYSVRFLLFEFDREIGDEKDYFAYHEKLEKAKLNVLRNYPYMYGFIEKCATESSESVKAMSKDALDRYKDAINNYNARLKAPSLKSGINREQLDNLIKFVVDGLTSKSLDDEKPDADGLYTKISEYFTLLKKMTTN